MLYRFLPLAALMYVCASLPASAQAQQAAEGGVRGRIVDSLTGRAVPTATLHLMRNQPLHSPGLHLAVVHHTFQCVDFSAPVLRPTAV